MGQDKEVKQKWKGPKNFDVCFSVMCSYYDQSLISGWEILGDGHMDLPTTYFEICLMFLTSFGNSWGNLYESLLY